MRPVVFSGMTGIRPVLKSWPLWLIVAASAAGFVVLVVTDDSGTPHASPPTARAPVRHGPRPLEWSGQIAVAVPRVGAEPTLVEVVTPERRTPTVVYRAPSFHTVRDLAWSPDGARLAVVVGAPQGPGHVFVMQSTGDDVTAVTHGFEITSTSVAWSPDGHRLAYDLGPTAHPERGTPIVVSRTDGSHRRVITPRHTFGFAPAWSPDGRTIAFVSAQAPGEFADTSGAVELVPASGGRPRKISGVYDGHDPVWSPEGRGVVFASSWAGGQGMNEVATRRGSRVFLAFDCTQTLKCDTVGRPTFAPGGGALGFIVAVDDPPRMLISVARNGALTDSVSVLRFPLSTCCLTWVEPSPGQSSV